MNSTNREGVKVEGYPTPEGELGEQALAALHPALRAWIASKGWANLRPIQAHAVQEIVARPAHEQQRHDVVISAPTASGKTMGALLPLAHRYLSRERPADGFSILYVSPLKALIRQQADREREISHLACAVAEASGAPFGVTPWNSDVDERRKRSAFEKPSGILLITPESIEGRLLHDPAGMRRVLQPLDAIVIDELHAYFDSPRGRHLVSLLARVDALRGEPLPVRIGLSATLGDDRDTAARRESVERINRFLRPDESRPALVLTETGVFDPERAAGGASESIFEISLTVAMDDAEPPPQPVGQPAPGGAWSRLSALSREEDEELEAGSGGGSRAALTAGEAAVADGIVALFRDVGRVTAGSDGVRRAVRPRSALVFANARQTVEDMTRAFNDRSPPVEFSNEWQAEIDRIDRQIVETEAERSALGSEGTERPDTERVLEGKLQRLNTKRERWASRDLFHPHHGSLDRSRRHHAENRMNSGGVGCILVCTTTLELGIDVGTIENVAQIGAGPSVASLRQRLGRSRRAAQMGVMYGDGEAPKEAPADPPRLDVFVIERPGGIHDVGLLPALRLQTVQAVAQLLCLRERAFEPPRNEAIDLSTITHQILCCLKQAESDRSVTVGALRQILTVAGPFRRAVETPFFEGGDWSLFDALLDHLADGERGAGLVSRDRLETSDPEKQALTLTTAGRKRTETSEIYAAFQTSEEYVVRTPGGRIGTLDVRVPVSPGQFIALSGRGWEVQSVNRARKEVRVRPAPTGRAPRFPGDAIPVSDIVVRKMRALYEFDDSVLSRLVEEARISGHTFAPSLEHGRATYREAGLRESQKIEQEGNVIVFPWAGDGVINAYLAVLRACLVPASAIGPVVIVPGITLRTLADTVATHRPLLRRLAQRPEELVRDFVNRPGGKFDDTLAQIFWRHDFVSHRLDAGAIEAAVELLCDPGEVVG